VEDDAVSDNRKMGLVDMQMQASPDEACNDEVSDEIQRAINEFVDGAA
jgi:hypothetical protein